MVASRRGGRDYQAEMPLEGNHEDLHVRGRADGYDSKTRRLDEYKTYRGDLARMPDNHRALHWAQAKMYGAMLCRKQQLRELRVALVYFDVDNEDETVVAEEFRADELQAFFEEHCALYGLWARSELEHREARNQALLALSFPYDFYPAQRQLAETVYRAAAISGNACSLRHPPAWARRWARCSPCSKPWARERSTGSSISLLKPLAVSSRSMR